MALVACAVLSRCSKNNEMGTPSISYIRITDPTKSDSLLSTAGQGQMIAIMGQNLGSVTQAWFNDQKAQLIPTFITNTTIITKVPSQLPAVITDKMKLVFANGSSLDYDFSVDIGKPSIDHVRTEYANEGDSVFIYGSFFYEPLTVSFTGGVQGTLFSVGSDNKSIVVKVPAGAQPGPITIATTFGSVTSHFWFNDNRNIIASFDAQISNWVWHTDKIVASDAGIVNINNGFLRVNKGKVTNAYLEVYEGSLETGADIPKETKNIPQEAFLDPNNYSLKFEINTLAPLAGANMRLYLGLANNVNLGPARDNIFYLWKPNVDTHGEWETITIPWSDVYSANQLFAYNSDGYAMAVIFVNTATYNLAIDNMRVVPNK